MMLGQRHETKHNRFGTVCYLICMSSELSFFNEALADHMKGVDLCMTFRIVKEQVLGLNIYAIADYDTL